MLSKCEAVFTQENATAVYSCTSPCWQSWSPNKNKHRGKNLTTQKAFSSFNIPAVKLWSHTTLRQNKAKTGPVLTDALDQVLLLIVSAAHYHLCWKDEIINVLGQQYQEAHREQHYGKQLCLELPVFCNHKFPFAWMSLSISPGIKLKSIMGNEKLQLHKVLF